MFNDERKSVEDVYRDLVVIGNELIAKNTVDIDKLIDKFKFNYESMSNEELRAFSMQLQIEAYYFGQKKDRAVLKQACAEALYKEKLANSYTTATGTGANKQNVATIEANNNLSVKLLYDMVANMMKTKLDEVHRLINVVSNVIISRNAEAKLQAGFAPDRNDTINNEV